MESEKLPLPQIDGKDVKLVFSFDALVRLEEETGFNILDPRQLIALSPVHIRDIAWCGLLASYPKLTRKDMHRHMTPLNLRNWNAAIFAALQEQVYQEQNAAEPESVS